MPKLTEQDRERRAMIDAIIADHKKELKASDTHICLWNFAEQSVAEKATWLAGKVRQATGVEHAKLELMTTCPELDLSSLKVAAAQANLSLDSPVSEDGRAIEMASTPGFQRWQDADLAALVKEEE